ncbi:MAG TPA: serine hydrolase [candidate division Zixibacteria bacterium]|nr:serine hydrolase [candidate division Zixibacteria bacterium]
MINHLTTARVIRNIALILALAVSLISVPWRICNAQETSAEALAGLWVSKRHLGPEIQGSLTLREEDGRWTASIEQFTVTASLTGGDLTFSLPGERGSFRGAYNRESGSVTGHWVQPPLIGAGVSYASPVQFDSAGPGIWRGALEPLANNITLFFSLQPPQDGAMNAFLRNPEFNFGRFFSITNVTLDEGNMTFVEAGRDQTRLSGSYNSEEDVFTLFIPDAGGSYDFKREVDSSSAFFPRARDNTAYVYRAPLPRADGWRTGDLASVDMAPEPIAALVERIGDTPMDDVTAPYIHALLIARRGVLVVEEYFHGYDGSPHDTRSAAKTITATLVGLAESQGLPAGLATPVYETMLEGGAALDTLDPRKREMTLEHLVTMSSGLECDDGDSNSPGNEDRMQSQSDQTDWALFTMDLPLAHPPGEVAAYCSGGMNLAAATLSRATGLWLPRFFDEYYAGPLQLGVYHMNLTPTGEGYGGGGLYLSARDFLKLGQLYLDGGVWNGRRLLTQEWVDEATSPQTHIWSEDYGYGWWIVSYPYRESAVTAYYAGGNGGQYVICVPELQLAVTFFAANYSQSIMHQTKREFVPQYIFPAILK